MLLLKSPNGNFGGVVFSDKEKEKGENIEKERTMYIYYVGVKHSILHNTKLIITIAFIVKSLLNILICIVLQELGCRPHRF